MFFLVLQEKKYHHMSEKTKYLKLMCYSDYMCAGSDYTDRLFSREKDLECDFL